MRGRAHGFDGPAGTLSSVQCDKLNRVLFDDPANDYNRLHTHTHHSKGKPNGGAQQFSAQVTCLLETMFESKSTTGLERRMDIDHSDSDHERTACSACLTKRACLLDHAQRFVGEKAMKESLMAKSDVVFGTARDGLARLKQWWSAKHDAMLAGRVVRRDRAGHHGRVEPARHSTHRS